VPEMVERRLTEKLDPAIKLKDARPRIEKRTSKRTGTGKRA
jgi:hypothetical protein